MRRVPHPRPIAAPMAVLAALALSLPAPALAATAHAAPVQAQVLESIQYAVLLDMDFGRVATTGAAGVIELNPSAGHRTCDPTLVCISGFTMSELRLTGSVANVQVNFDPAFQLTGPGDPILAQPMFPGGHGAVVTISGGQAVVSFGARLFINPGQAPASMPAISRSSPNTIDTSVLRCWRITR